MDEIESLKASIVSINKTLEEHYKIMEMIAEGVRTLDLQVAICIKKDQAIIESIKVLGATVYGRH